MRLRSPPVQRMSQGWSQRGPLRAAAARGAARHQRTRLPPTQCDAAAQLWVASCAAVMSSKVNAASSLRPRERKVSHTPRARPPAPSHDARLWRAHAAARRVKRLKRREMAGMFAARPLLALP
jgi:hypothetical protein